MVDVTDAEFDVVVVGSGAAGMMAALIAGEAHRVALVTDRGLGTSNSAVAQGGLQFPEAGQQARDAFRADMLASGGPSVDVARLDHFVDSVRDVVLLLERWGLELDRDPEGRLRRLSAGGLSEPRIVTSGARIGPAVLKVLRSRVLDSDVEVFTGTSVSTIGPGVDSALVVGTNAGEFRSSALIVATGGRSFERADETGVETSNPVNANGSMQRVLAELGLQQRDADVFQFHPYGIVDPNGVAGGKCVPESVVSMGAFVGDDQRRPIVAPTADRAEVTAAMRRCLEEGRGVARGSGSACRLVLTGVDETALYSRYPHLKRQLNGARLGDGDVPVRPVVHYQLGGFEVGPDGSTMVDGLFLAGELTGGLHGQNRLMGNGITEAVVDGWSAGHAVRARLAAREVNQED